MQFLAALSGPGAISVLSGTAVVVAAAALIRLFWRRGTTPWDA